MKNSTKLQLLDRFEEFSKSTEHTESLRLQMQVLIDEVRNRVLDELDRDEAIEYIKAKHKKIIINQ